MKLFIALSRMWWRIDPKRKKKKKREKKRHGHNLYLLIYLVNKHRKSINNGMQADEVCLVLVQVPCTGDV